MDLKSKEYGFIFTNQIKNARLDLLRLNDFLQFDFFSIDFLLVGYFLSTLFIMLLNIKHFQVFFHANMFLQTH